MKAVRGRSVFSACVISTFVVIFSGCTIGGKSFSIDSNSRIPFFGLELKERKPKSTAPAYQSIARTKNDTSSVKNALQVTPAAPGTDWKRRDRRLGATPVPGVTTVREPSVESRSTANDPHTVAIPLPRTDTAPVSANRTGNLQNFADFQ